MNELVIRQKVGQLIREQMETITQDQSEEEQ